MLDGLLVEPGKGGRGQGAEAGCDLGAFGALTYDVAAGATAGNQQQRIDHDGLAGAGFTGKYAQTRAKFQFRLIDDHQIAQLQMSEHFSADDVKFQDGRSSRRVPNAAWSAVADSSRSPADAAA